MVKIEKVTIEELPKVRQLLSFVWSCTYGDRLSPQAIEKITAVWHNLESLTKQAQNPHAYFPVAKVDGKIVGVATAQNFGETTVLIYRLYVHPDHQGKGIGHKLLENILSEFPDAKLAKIEVEKFNIKAISFYEKNGFNKVDVKEETVEGETLKCIVMEKEL